MCQSGTVPCTGVIRVNQVRENRTSERIEFRFLIAPDLILYSRACMATESMYICVP